MRFGILKKFLAAFLLLSLVPLLFLSYVARNQLMEVGLAAIDTSRNTLIANATTLLEARAIGISRQVERLLESVCDDLRVLALLPADPEVYARFSSTHQRAIWTRPGDAGAPHDSRFDLPLYREITFAAPDGREIIRIHSDRVAQENRDVSGTFTGLFGPEDYFSRTRGLPPDAIHVSRLTGYHITRDQQLRGQPDVETAVNDLYYDGIIRFSMTVYREGRFAGVVSLALDHRHLMEYTQHILPVGSADVVFPSYSSGNYGFLFDDQGWIITHPKFWDIRGFDRSSGRLVDPASTDYNEENMKKGLIPFNLLNVPFIHTNYRQVALDVMSGKTGVTRTASVGGVSRILAYAPIRFGHGEYRQSGYFGGVTLGARTDSFHRAIDNTATAIGQAQKRAVGQFALIILVAGTIVACISVGLARSFTRPILYLAGKVRRIANGKFDVTVDIRSGDELEFLGRNFQEMGERLEANQKSLTASLQKLETSKEEIETSNCRLEKQLNILNNIQAAGLYLSLTFSQKDIIATMLKTCVEGIGFARALIYLYNPKTQRLECNGTYGFSEEIRTRAMAASYRLHRHDCIQCRVFNSGEAMIVQDVRNDDGMTDLDRQIAEQSHARGFAFAPILTPERTIGVLGADFADRDRPLEDEEVESLKILANDAAMGIERARLMTRTLREKGFIESIFANMLSGLLVVRPDGTLRSINQRAEQFIQADGGVLLVDHHIDTVLKPFPELLAAVSGSLASGQGTSVEIVVDGSTDKKVYLETAITPLQVPEETRGKAMLVLFRDISQRKEMQKHINRSDRLVSLGTLAAGIAHEIRNPLTGISLLLDDLHDRMATRLEERLMMQSALEEIEKLEKLVTELLEFAAKPSSQLVARDLNKVIDLSLFFVQKQCNRQGIELIREKEPMLPPVDLDPEKIKQAVLNILLNSLCVLEEGGLIFIRTRNREDLDIFPDGRAVELVISDNGPGIHKDDINFIFDPFFTRNPKGSGLGLSITHSIVEEHKGKILVESKKGEGASFKIYFPVSRQESTS